MAAQGQHVAAQGQHLAAQGHMHLKKFSVEEVGPIAFRNVIGPTLEYTFESFFDAFGDFLELGGHPGHPWPPWWLPSSQKGAKSMIFEVTLAPLFGHFSTLFRNTLPVSFYDGFVEAL